MSIRSMLNKTLALAVGIGAFCTVAAEAGKPSSKVLIAYYSYSGNTRAAAKQIQKKVGGDLWEIKPVKAYPAKYNACVALARKEIKEGFTPALTGEADLSRYSIIFIGSPNWWGTLAPPVYTFVKKSNLEGKTIIPFFTHGGGGMQNCETDMQKYCKAGKAGKVLKAFTCSGHLTGDPIPELEKWAADSLKKAAEK